jgi:hypothetical protein
MRMTLSVPRKRAVVAELQYFTPSVLYFITKMSSSPKPGWPSTE